LLIRLVPGAQSVWGSGCQIVSYESHLIVVLILNFSTLQLIKEVGLSWYLLSPSN